MPKTTKQKLMDTLGWGIILWATGYLLGMMLFAFVSLAVMGIIISVIMFPVTIYVAWRRLRKSDQPKSYFFIVGIVWAAIPVLFDYVFLVKALSPENYYDADIFVYYGTALLIPIIVGLLTNKKSAAPESKSNEV